MPSLSNITVFLSMCSEKQESIRSELASVLHRAGISVVPDGRGVFETEDFVSFTSKIATSSCSVHIIFPEYAPLMGNGVSLAKTQFLEAKKNLSSNPDFRIFVWLPPTTNSVAVEQQQVEFINEVKNNITKNMVFSNAASSIQLVDDIRSQMETNETIVFDVNATDIFLMSNQLDEIDANEIIDMLSDIVPVEKLNIIQDSDTDYSELCKQQIPKSKLAVIYFKESGDWALPFAQQVWKKIGGATSHTPILLIGDTDPQTNMGKKFSAPKVISLIVEGTLIPLEIKVQYDKIILPTA